MITLKRYLAESVDLKKLEFEASSLKPTLLKGSDFNKPSPYDWFILYKIEQEFSTSVGRAFDKWKKDNPPGHPMGFMLYWLRELSSPAGKIVDGFSDAPGRHSYEELWDFLDQDIMINGSTVRVMGDLELWQFDQEKSGALIIEPPPKLHMVGGYVDISSCSFATLPTWLPEVIGTNLRVRNCKNLTSLHDIHKTIRSCKKIDLAGTPIESSVLGLLKIENLKFVKFTTDLGGKSEMDSIINKYLHNHPIGNKRLMECQSELLDAGLEEFAKL